MTKLHILSDLHLEFSTFEPPATDADVIILAGDIGKGNKGDEAFTEDMARALSERLQAETLDPWADPILRAAKNDYQEKCRADVRAGIVSEESMHLFSREMAGKVTIEYRDVDYE